MRIDVCTDMYMDTRTDMCIDMRIDMCTDMYRHMRIGVCMDICAARLEAGTTARPKVPARRLHLVCASS